MYTKSCCGLFHDFFHDLFQLSLQQFSAGIFFWLCISAPNLFLTFCISTTYFCCIGSLSISTRVLNPPIKSNFYFNYKFLVGFLKPHLGRYQNFLGLPPFVPWGLCSETINSTLKSVHIFCVRFLARVAFTRLHSSSTSIFVPSFDGIFDEYLARGKSEIQWQKL